MDHESSDDEDVYSFCKQLGIKIPPKKNKKNIFITTNNLENIDTKNLPVTILRRNDHNVCEHSEILQYHLMEIEANVSSPVLTSSINLQIEPQLPISMEVSSILEDLSSIQVSSDVSSNMVLEPILREEAVFSALTVVEISAVPTVEDNSVSPPNEIPQSLQMEVEYAAPMLVAVSNPLKASPDEHGDLTVGRKRRSKRCSNTKTFSKNKNKVLRMEGSEYLGYRRDRKDEKFKVLHDTIRPARKMGPRCTSKFCKKSKFRACHTLTDDDRNSLFLNYWKNITWDQRKQYVISHVQLCQPKQVKSIPSRRSETKQYFLTNSHTRLQVCKHSFLNTLGIKEWTIRYWLSTAALGMAKKPELTRNVVEGHFKKEEIDFLKNFFICLPKMPSHYCRASSTRQYLEPIIQNKNHLYKIYCNKCTEENKQIVSRWSFDRIFAEQNLSLFHPKKDQCDTCCSFKVGNISEEDYHKHISLKESARDEKNKDKIWALAGEIHLFTHDLQSVQLCPMLQASALYYKTKLCVHNFTMYNLATKDVHCYWFDEHNAGLVASVFVSCIIDCLKKSLTDKLKPIVLFSDGCTDQNRNAILANALLELAMEYKVVITQKFLEKGHTQMECDASHSAIECKIKNKDIYLPSQYALISKEARPKQPFIVNYLSYDFFDDYSNKNYYLYESIRPGRVANDPTVTDLRVLEYSPDGIIKYKLSFEDEYRELPRRPKTSQRKSGSKPKLYNSHLKINESKWKHLQELKTVIPSDCHSFYDSLLY